MSNVKFALAAIAVTLASGAALAQEAIPAQWNNPYAPDVSVRQVQPSKTSADAAVVTNSSAKPLSRADVRAEFLAARRSGESNAFDADPYANVSARVAPVATHTQLAAR